MSCRFYNSKNADGDANGMSPLDGVIDMPFNRADVAKAGLRHDNGGGLSELLGVVPVRENGLRFMFRMVSELALLL